MLRDGAARLQPALLLALAHDRRLAAKRPEAEEAAPVLAHILDVGFAAADSIKIAGVEIRLCERPGVLDLLAVVQVRGEPLTQADDEIRARVFVSHGHGDVRDADGCVTVVSGYWLCDTRVRHRWR